MKHIFNLIKWIFIALFALSLLIPITILAFPVAIFKSFWKRKVGNGLDNMATYFKVIANCSMNSKFAKDIGINTNPFVLSDICETKEAMENRIRFHKLNDLIYKINYIVYFECEFIDGILQEISANSIEIEKSS